MYFHKFFLLSLRSFDSSLVCHLVVMAKISIPQPQSSSEITISIVTVIVFFPVDRDQYRGKKKRSVTKLMKSISSRRSLS
jgi:hypothetical protein